MRPLAEVRSSQLRQRAACFGGLLAATFISSHLAAALTCDNKTLNMVKFNTLKEGQDYSDVIRFGTPLTISNGTRYFEYGQAMMNGFSLFMNWLTVRGGISVGGRMRPVEIILVDDRSDQNCAAKVTNYIINHMNVDFLLGGYRRSGSGLVEEARKANKVAILPSTPFKADYGSDRPTVFGMSLRTSDLMTWIFVALVHNTSNPSKRIKRSAVCVRYTVNGVPYGQTERCCDLMFTAQKLGWLTSAAIVDLEIPGPEFEGSAVQQQLALDTVKEIQSTQKDVVFVLLHRDDCKKILRAARLRNFNPQAFTVLQECIDRMEEEDPLSGHWLIGITLWIPALGCKSEMMDGWTSETLSEEYTKQFNRKIKVQAAASFSAMEVYVKAIEDANSTETEAVMWTLGNITYNSTYGVIKFSEAQLNYHQNIGKAFITQMQGEVPRQPLLVGPLRYPGIVEAQLPFPRWHAHRCHFKLPHSSMFGYGQRRVGTTDPAAQAAGNLTKELLQEALEYGVTKLSKTEVKRRTPISKFKNIAKDAWPGDQPPEMAESALITITDLVFEDGVQELLTASKLATLAYFFTPVGRRICGPCDIDEVAVWDNVTQQRYCRSCPPGKQVLHEKETKVCEQACPDGSIFSAALGRCQACPSGKYERVGASVAVCENCKEGRYSNEPGYTECKKCEAGKFAISESMSECKDCPPGTEAPRQGFSVCTLCNGGTIANEPGFKICELCKQGFVATARGSTACDGCSPGRYSNWGSTRCKPCLENEFQHLSEQWECISGLSGATFEGTANTKGFNEPKYWTRAQGDVLIWEFCEAVPGGCLQNETCVQGTTGVHCTACLPGYGTYSNPRNNACFECPGKFKNVILTLLVITGVTFSAWVLAFMAIHSQKHPNDVHVIVLKQVLHHGILIGALSFVVRDCAYTQQLEIGESITNFIRVVTWWGQQFRGDLAVETSHWSIQCLFDSGDDALAAALSKLKHSEWFLDSTAPLRKALADHRRAVEEKVLIFWIFWPLIISANCLLLSSSLLTVYYFRHKEFYIQANKMYRDLIKYGNDYVYPLTGEKRYSLDEVANYAEAFNYRMFGILWPFQYLSRVHNQQFRFKVARFIRETRPLVQASLLLCYGWTAVGVLRPMYCKHYGIETEPRVVAATSLICTWTKIPALRGLCIPAMAFFLGIYPLSVYLRLRKQADRDISKDQDISYSVFSSGLLPECAWWDGLNFFVKFGVVWLAFLDIQMNYKIPFQMFASMAYASVSATMQPYDRRRDGMLVNMELVCVCTWVCSCILAELAYLTGTAAAWTVCLSAIIFIHAVLLTYFLSVLIIHSQSAYLRAVRQHPGWFSKWLMRRRDKALKKDPYVYFDHTLGWCTVCGSRGDLALPPYASYRLGRPDLSESPPVPSKVPDEPQVMLATKEQKTALQRTMEDTVASVSVGLKDSTTFSISILEFVIRVGFFLGKRASQDEEGRRYDDGGAVDNNDIRDVRNLAMEDSLERQSIPEHAIDDYDEHRHLGNPSSDPEAMEKVMKTKTNMAYKLKKRLKGMSGDRFKPEDADVEVKETLFVLEEDLRTAIGLSRHALEKARFHHNDCFDEDDAIGELVDEGSKGINALKDGVGHVADKVITAADKSIGPPAMSTATDLVQDERVREAENLNLSMHRKRQLQDWVGVMFDPLLFENGIRMEVLQMGMMHLQWMSRSDVGFLVDLFEDRWLTYNRWKNSVLRRNANMTKDTGSQVDPKDIQAAKDLAAEVDKQKAEKTEKADAFHADSGEERKVVGSEEEQYHDRLEHERVTPAEMQLLLQKLERHPDMIDFDIHQVFKELPSRRLDPLLDNKACTFEEMCDAHDRFDGQHKKTMEQKRLHWSNLPAVVPNEEEGISFIEFMKAFKQINAALRWCRFALTYSNAFGKNTALSYTSNIFRRLQRQAGRSQAELAQVLAREKELCEQAVLKRKEVEKEAAELRRRVVGNLSAMKYFEEETKRLNMHSIIQSETSI